MFYECVAEESVASLLFLLKSQKYPIYLIPQADLLLLFLDSEYVKTGWLANAREKYIELI